MPRPIISTKAKRSKTRMAWKAICARTRAAWAEINAFIGDTESGSGAMPRPIAATKAPPQTRPPIPRKAP